MRSTMTAVCRALFLLAFCLAWCGVVVATEGETNDEALDPTARKVMEGTSVGDEAMAWQPGVSGNFTSLLSSLQEASEAVKGAEEKLKQESLPSTISPTLKSLETKINEAKEAAQRVKNMDNATFKTEEIEKVKHEFFKTINPGSGGANDASEIKRMAVKAAKLWEEAMTFIEPQLSEAQEAASKTEAAAKAASDAMEALSTETANGAEKIKEEVGKANETLHSAVGHASSMKEAAEEVKQKAQEALKALREVAGLPTAPNDMHEQKEKEKKTPGRNNTTDKSTGGTDERTEKGTTKEDTTADDTTNVGTTNRQLQEDSSPFTFLQTSYLTALLVFLFLLI